MAAHYTRRDDQTYATLTCDREGCDAVYDDGLAEYGQRRPVHGRAGEAGWHFCRPTPDRQTDICPSCPPDEHY